MTSSTDLLQQLDLPALSDSSDTDDFLQELVALNDAGLLRATVESLECGRLTPLIKEELRCRIQSRRLSEGKEELLVEFPSPTTSQPRPDEVEKRDRRREQNRRAAQKFRKKKKQRGEHLIEETQRLECHNTTLRSEIRQLHEERDQLARIIQTHASVCPLTPHQSPLTIPRESPLPQHSGGSPLPPPPPPPPPPSSSNMPVSSPIRKSPMLIQGAGYNASHSSRESPATVILLSPACGEHHPSSTSSGRLIIASPVQMSGRPRKSPVPLLRPSQSPVSGERSPVPLLGSPRKQNKQSNLRLNLAGPKPVKPILPKGSLAIIQSCTSPKTPLGIITSPLPISQSPVSFGGRALHQSPVFFGEGCFTPSAKRNQYPNQSPISFTDSNSTPGHHVPQSPVFFGEKSPNVAFTCPNFVQPLSVSSTSSTSSLASLLRQESPLSVASNSSILSAASSVFLPGPNSSNINSNNSNTNTLILSEQNLSAFCPSSTTTPPTQAIVNDKLQTNICSNEQRNIPMDNSSNTFASGHERGNFTHYRETETQRQYECPSANGMEMHDDTAFDDLFPSPEGRGGSMSDLTVLKTQPENPQQPAAFRMEFPSTPNATPAMCVPSQNFSSNVGAESLASQRPQQMVSSYNSVGQLQGRAQLSYENASKHSAFSNSLMLQDNFGPSQEDNTLSVEDIERSVAAGESVDPLLDFIDIQELLGLNTFHNNNNNNNQNNNGNNSNTNNTSGNNSNDNSSNNTAMNPTTNSSINIDSNTRMSSNNEAINNRPMGNNGDPFSDLNFFNAPRDDSHFLSHPTN